MFKFNGGALQEVEEEEEAEEEAERDGEEGDQIVFPNLLDLCHKPPDSGELQYTSRHSKRRFGSPGGGGERRGGGGGGGAGRGRGRAEAVKP